MTITISGEPKSTQHIYKAACRGGFVSYYMSAEGKAIKAGYQLEARAQWRRPLRTEPLELDITLYFGTKRRADADNFHKLSLDALSGVVYEDDSQITDLHIHKRYDKQRPRIEITIGH